MPRANQLWVLGVVLGALVSAAGCGGCGGDESGDVDGGGADGMLEPDGAADSDAAPAGDGGGDPDAIPTCTAPIDCEPDPLRPICDVEAGECVQCLEKDHCTLYQFSHECDTDERACVECLEQAHCDADPSALGPTCNTTLGYCQCGGDDECTDNPNGTVCDFDVNACSCVSDEDCTPPATCELTPYLGEGKKTCQVLPM
jgi:hypothetical protein